MSNKPDLGALFGAAADTSTFLGLESCGDLYELSAPVALIGAPGGTPYASVGCYSRNAPDALRKTTGSLVANIDRHDFDFGERLFPQRLGRPVDCGDLPFGETDGAGNRKAIFDSVMTTIRRGGVPVLIGGDDSVPIPMVEAVGAASPGQTFTILQIDAHIDWRDVHMGERLGLSSTMRRSSEMPHIERIIQVGARGIGSAATGDYQDALEWGVKFVTAWELHRDGVVKVLELIPKGSNVIVCIDADALDPSVIPAVIGRAPGGLNFYQAVELIRGVAGRGRIAAMDFVEFMPERDVDEIGALNFARLIMIALGVLVRQSGEAAIAEPTGSDG